MWFLDLVFILYFLILHYWDVFCRRVFWLPIQTEYPEIQKCPNKRAHTHTHTTIALEMIYLWYYFGDSSLALAITLYTE